MKKLKYCVYILLSLKDQKFYIGYSANLNQRLTAHINGYSQSTQLRRPFILIFYEYYHAKQDALRREKYLKITAGNKTPKLMLKDSFIKLIASD